MSRFQGYVGIVSSMGARFTASEQALAPMLRETAKRGLIFVDDGANPRSVAARIAGGTNLPFAKADMVIDAVPTPAEIDHALGRLEMSAREHGFAIGMASALPVSIERIAKWAKARKPRHADRADHRGGVEGQAELKPRSASSAMRTALASRPYSLLLSGFAVPPHSPIPACASKISLSALRRPDGAQSRRSASSSAAASTGPTCRRHACLADAARRHRSGRGPVAGGAARALRGDQHPLGGAARRDRRLAQLRHPARASSAMPGAASIAARRRNGLRCALPARQRDRHRSRRPADTSRNSWTGAGKTCIGLPDLVVPFKRAVYERVVARVSSSSLRL